MASQLLVVDMQEKLIAGMADGDRARDRCATLLNAAAMLSIPTLLTEQYPAGLGPTDPLLLSNAGSAEVIPKVHFSCFAEENLHKRLMDGRDGGRDTVVLAGLEAHVCIARTAIDMIRAGFRVVVARDAVASRRAGSCEIGLERLHLSGADVIATEAIIHQWFGRAAQ